MPVTTLKLPAELKQRIAAVVEGSGQSMHAFMVRAVEEETRRAELRRAFHADALAAREEAFRTGLAHPAAAVHAYIRSRVNGKRATRPKAKPWRG
ncbi:MAG: hypothetical protein EXR72_01600 [Myxococcales bacterium]|nr:hypothetical protein [Myxococcales bacterium]